MKIKKIKNGFKKVNFFGFEIARLEFGFFRRLDDKYDDKKPVTYRVRITENNSTGYFTDPTHGLIDFLGCAKDIYK